MMKDEKVPWTIGMTLEAFKILGMIAWFVLQESAKAAWTRLTGRAV